MEDNRLDLLFVFDNKGFHGDVVVFMVLPQRTQRTQSLQINFPLRTPCPLW
ncbi:hypothetical protein M089_4561 [Bacteroides ovatus str. 3725 D9 iii]|nr:hypothetical protein M088_4093 [Bacteroides ovatus str. 3725 D1 iv]KDS20154.1 hypothetical protein M082_2172 [Bacteroides fragilis str. 3725 D9 ii]KDS25053.1 hypothetical protein M089_4561 [Bacteroides ovatus str. 3725 D9 iii]